MIIKLSYKFYFFVKTYIRCTNGTRFDLINVEIFRFLDFCSLFLLLIDNSKNLFYQTIVLEKVVIIQNINNIVTNRS
jgi:hypothetical protein